MARQIHETSWNILWPTGSCSAASPQKASNQQYSVHCFFSFANHGGSCWRPSSSTNELSLSMWLAVLVEGGQGVQKKTPVNMQSYPVTKKWSGKGQLCLELQARFLDFSLCGFRRGRYVCGNLEYEVPALGVQVCVLMTIGDVLNIFEQIDFDTFWHDFHILAVFCLLMCWKMLENS